MARLVWGAVGQKRYETGVDQGVICTREGKVVVWDGLISVVEKNARESTLVHYDGRVAARVVAPNTFNATVSAYTYPNEIFIAEGNGLSISSVLIADQAPIPFHLAYKTNLGNDVTEEAGYRLHVVYNVVLMPSDKTYATIAENMDAIQFEWDAIALSGEIDGFLPSSHFIFDSTLVDADLLASVELAIYGGDTANPNFPSFDSLTSTMLTWLRIRIVDNLDGTWTATGPENDLRILEDGSFTIAGVNIITSTSDEYTITSTRT